MVYYLTSGNIKLLRKILLIYNDYKDFTPQEFIENYIKQSGDSTNEQKSSWIVDTFMGVQKHKQFLQELVNNMTKELLEEKQAAYLAIILYSIIFEISPKRMDLLYKCLFNLDKTLLQVIMNFFTNDEALTLVRQIAQSFYDIRYIIEKIMAPLQIWQPFITDMKIKFAESILNMKKPPTIPVPPNLSIKINETLPPLIPTSPAIPITLHTNKKMLTKDSIDEKLQREFERNREKATQLLKNVKSINNHYAQNKSDRYKEVVTGIKNELENKEKYVPFRPKHVINKNSSVPPRDTVATIRRMNKTMREIEHREIEWLETLLNDFRDLPKIEELERCYQFEREKKRLMEIEKKHLKGLISFEQAVIAKKQLIEENKRKYINFLKERDTWNAELEKWRKIEIEKNREQVEKWALQKEAALQSKYENILKKKDKVREIKQETELLLSKAIKEKNEEMERKINLIKEMKVLSVIGRKAKLPKIVDLTETSGLGLLCEMSIAELQERINIAKIDLHEELNKKKALIRETNLTKKRELRETKELIDEFLKERKESKELNKKILQQRFDVAIEIAQEEEISNLKKMLAEKRKQRIG